MVDFLIRLLGGYSQQYVTELETHWKSKYTEAIDDLRAQRAENARFVLSITQLTEKLEKAKTHEPVKIGASRASWSSLQKELEKQYATET